MMLDCVDTITTTTTTTAAYNRYYGHYRPDRMTQNDEGSRYKP